MKILKNPIRFNENRPNSKRILVKPNLTETEWETLNMYAGLPIKAKSDINNAIADYQFQKNIKKETPIPNEVKEELKRLTNIAKKLKEGLYNPLSADFIYTIGSVDREAGPYAQAAYVMHFNDIRKQAGILYGVLQKASRKVKMKKSGADTMCVDQ